MDILVSLSEAVQQCDQEKAVRLTKEALEKDIPADKILDDGLMAGMEIVGEKFGAGELFIPEVLMSGEALKAATKVLEPHLTAGKRSQKGKVVLATVKGDIHDLGKNLVAMTLTSSGFEVIDLGVDVPEEDMVEAVKNHQPNYLGLSALLTTTMPEMKKIINALQEEGLRDSCKVIVGGAPVSEEYAREISADLYAENAMEAVEVLTKSTKG